MCWWRPCVLKPWCLIWIVALLPTGCRLLKNQAPSVFSKVGMARMAPTSWDHFDHSANMHCALNTETDTSEYPRMHLSSSALEIIHSISVVTRATLFIYKANFCFPTRPRLTLFLLNQLVWNKRLSNPLFILTNCTSFVWMIFNLDDDVCRFFSVDNSSYIYLVLTYW